MTQSLIRPTPCAILVSEVISSSISSWYWKGSGLNLRGTFFGASELMELLTNVISVGEGKLGFRMVVEVRAGIAIKFVVKNGCGYWGESSLVASNHEYFRKA